MNRFLCFFMIIPILLCSFSSNVLDLFEEVNMIEFYYNGQQIEISSDQQEKFEELFCNALEGAQQMPAFGVSLHDLTMQNMKEGLWIKFIYNKTIVKSEMPFDSILINITKDCHGINLIRGNDEIFEGRCYYLNLKGTLDDVYDFLIECIQTIENKIEVELDFQEQEQITIKGEIDLTETDDESENKNSSLAGTKSSNEILKHLN